MPRKNNRNTRGRIIAAAWKLFYENGYEETTVEDILFESGTSQALSTTISRERTRCWAVFLFFLTKSMRNS